MAEMYHQETAKERRAYRLWRLERHKSPISTRQHILQNNLTTNQGQRPTI